MEYQDEANKVRHLIESEPRNPAAAQEIPLQPRRFSRFTRVKPEKLDSKRRKKEQQSIEILHIDEQEKSGASQRWNRAALHAHHCCVSQRHPAYVHLEQLLVKTHPLSERVTLWKMKSYLRIAKRLESFVKTGLEVQPRKTREFSAFACKPSSPAADHQQMEQWDEYLQAQEKRLFQVPNPTK